MASFNHEAGKANVRFQFHVVGGSDDFRFHGTLKVGDFLGALVNQQDHRMHFRMVGGDGVANLLENGGLAGAGRRHDQTARAFADGCDEVNHPGFEQVRRGFELKFFDGVNAGQVLKAHGLGVFLERHGVDLVHGLELRTGAAVRRLGGAFNKAAFAQEAAADGVRRDKNIGGFGMEMILRRAEESETFFGDFEIAGAVVGIWRFIAVCLRFTHM